MKNLAAALFGLGVALSASHALADDACSPLRMITQIEFTPSTDNLQISVPVKINGVSKLMVLDTGAAATTIAASAATALGFDVTQGGRIELVGAYGKGTTGIAHSGSFELGSIHADSVKFILDPSYVDAQNSDVIGAIGSDILANYDIEIDMAAHKVTFLSPDHCPGKVIYWPAQAAAAVPFKLSDDRSIGINVILDGKPLKAMIDTGASDNVLNRKVAEGMGLKMGSPNTPDTGTLTDQLKSRTYTHEFQTLDFEGIAVSKPTFYIIPNLMKLASEQIPTGTRLSDNHSNSPEGLPDAIIGMSTLRHLHIYIAYKEKMLYLTP